MKIKLTQEGFENYTGQMGVHFFENGLSTADVSFRDSARMAAVMNCEYEDGTNCSPSQRLLDSALVEADSTRDTFDEPAKRAAAPEAPAADVLTSTDVDPNKGASDEGEGTTGTGTDTVADDAAPSNLWTADELGQIADKDGIVGLRAIADPLNVKSNSIANLITALIAANAKKV